MPSLLGARTLDVNIRSAPQMREYELIASRIAGDRPVRLLDWGCGAGQMTALLRGRGLDVTAYDYLPGLEEPVVRALEHYPEVEAHLSSEPVALPFEDGTFDAVLSCGVLEHVQDPDASLEELKRVLEPGGTLYVYKLPNKTSYLEAIARTANRLGAGIYYHGFEPYDRIYTERSARALLERHGYRVRELGLANMLPLTLPGRLAQRYAELIWRLNGMLSKVPGLRRLATTVELVADAPRP
jgi:2-polyprenyl-6-hydroxyphenyl methylase/3-demethylubiquinone-9 3-methyltransferase